MSHSRSLLHKTGRTTCAIIAGAALIAGCANNSSGGTTASDDTGADSTESGSALVATHAGIIGDQEDSGQPTAGGTLRFSGFSLPPTLDPADPRSQAHGATGGTEEINVYGALMRYDADKDRFVPQMAKDLTVSDDNLTWTLTLRDGVTFSDGTPYDADAVAASINRYSAVQGSTSPVFTAAVDAVEATDPATVVFHMNTPWNELPAALSYGYGMIVAPAGYADPGNFQPIGAGPFIVDDFVPSTSLALRTNPDYWDGAPHLDAVDFSSLAPGDTQVQALKTGDLDMTFLRDAQSVAEAAKEFPGYYEPLSMDSVLQINNRDGHPGANPQVREAIAAAINPEAISRQAFAGTILPTTELFPSWSMWHSDVPGYTYDPDHANQLLEAAESDGFDGEITYVSMNAGSSRKIAQAVQSMLTDAGFTVDVQYVQPGDILQRLYIDHDFDITYGSGSVGDAAPLLPMYGAFTEGGPNNITGFSSPQMDTALADAMSATGESDRKSTMATVARTLHDAVPFVSVGSGASFVAWRDDVHGVTPTVDAIVLLGNTWIAK